MLRPLPVLTVAALLGACSGPTRKAPGPTIEPVVAEGLRATIQWTSYGVPHVTADDLAGLGFGQGYATAKHHVCVIADQILRVTSRRSRWFGRGDDDRNLDSDFFHLHVGVEARAQALLQSMSEDARDVMRGWVAGYNHYVARTRPGELPEPCRGAGWVQPIDEVKLAQLHVGLAMIASSRRFERDIARAAPTTAPKSAAKPSGDKTSAAWAPLAADPGSNGWAIGGDRTEHDHGILVANPHFPWEGELRFAEIHLTIPGEIDVYGATIPGMPMVAIGFTRHHAWTHTFSSSTRFVLYRLRLDKDAYHYLRDTDSVAMTHTEYEVGVALDDGAPETVKRTLYRSTHGPIVDTFWAPWDLADGAAYALRDVALEAGSGVDMYLGFARARSLDDFRLALQRHATPYLNTLYADVDGQALYADGSNVPSLTAEAIAQWELTRKAIPAIAQAWQFGIVVLDGSSQVFDLVTENPDVPGTVASSSAPEVLRRDFVMNANDSWAFTHPDVARTATEAGFSPLYGGIETPSPRTLMNLRLLQEKTVTGGSGPDGLFTRAEAAKAVLSNRSFTGEQLRDDVLARCDAEVKRRLAAVRPVKKGKKKPSPPISVEAESLELLCLRLKGWDLTFDLDSQGAVLWRELMAVLAPDGAIPWDLAYDPQAPSTPTGLPPAPSDGPDPLAGAIEDAAEALAARGIDIRASNPPLRDVQRAVIRSGGEGVAVPGGVELDGVTNKVQYVDWNGTLLPRGERGDVPYPINYGTSWVMAVELLPTGPVADVLLTYGPEHQLESFAEGALRPALFEPAAIAADPQLEIEEIASP